MGARKPKGSKPAVKADKILQVLLQYDLYQDNKLKTKKDPIWQQIVNDLDGRINVTNVYYQVSQDRHNILSHYRLEKNIESYADNIHNKNDCDDIEIAYKTDSESDDDFIINKKARVMKINKKELIVFDIALTQQEWSKIKPIKKIYKDGREEDTLQQGWCDTLRRHIYANKKLPCAFNFKRHIVDSCDDYIKGLGYCSDCKAPIEIYCRRKPNDDEIVSFKIETIDMRGVPHTKKNRLQGKERESVQEELKHKKPKQWRLDKAGEMMDYGDPEPPILYNSPTLSAARQAIKNKSLGIQKGSSLFDSLAAFKRSILGHKFVKNIGFDKFFLTYWCLEQISVNNDIITKLNNPFTLDSTSSIALKVKREDADSSNLYLTILSTHINNMIVPVAQTISEVNDTNFLLYWLNDFFKSGAKKPHLIITDMSKALQNAICLSCNTMTLREYYKQCFLILNGRSTSRDIHTQIQTDIAHLQRAVSRWPCFSKGCPSRVKELYLRCTGFMSTIETLNQFTQFLENLFIFAGSEFSTSITREAKSYLAERIKTFEFESGDILKTLDTESEKENENECDVRLDAKEEKSIIETYINKIKLKVDDRIESYKSDSVDDDFGITNDFYLPEFINRFCVLSKDFICWSNVMLKHFNNSTKVSTSSRIEALFKQTKCSILEDKIPIRVDKFLIQHCNEIDNAVKLARAAINNTSYDVVDKKWEQNDDYLQHSERWKNKIDLPDTIHEDSVSFDTSYSLLENNKSCDEHISKDDPPNGSLISAPHNLHYNSSFITLDHSYSKSNDNSLDTKTNDINNVPIFMVASTNFPIPLEKSCNKLVSDDDTQDCNFECKIKVSYTDASKEEKSYFDKGNICEDKSNKTRGFYVSPAPDIDIRLSQNTKKVKINTKKRANIKNGNSLLPKVVDKMNNVKIAITNTCPFDSITEVLSSCCDFSSFRRFLESQKNYADSLLNLCYASAVLQYSEVGITPTIYMNRFHILQKLLIKDRNIRNCTIIDCGDSVHAIFQLLMKNYECANEIITCRCGYKKTNSKIITTLPHVNIVWQNNYKNLEAQLIEGFKEKTVYCHLCERSCAKLNFILGPYLYIDVEDAYRDSQYARQLQVNVDNLYTCLKDLPTELHINNTLYILGGVVRYVPPLQESEEALLKCQSLGHYIAYCRTVNNDWIKRNDLETTRKTLSPKNLPSIKIASIFYIKI